MAGPELSVIVPTYKERGNVAELVRRLDAALSGIAWEAIYVDDNSPDGTAEAVKEIAAHDPRIRCLRRVGRRGLAGACVEGMLSSAAPFVAVIDADLQHDEKVLPLMLTRLRYGEADLIAGTRYVGGGSAAGLSQGRGFLSRLATALTRLLVGTELSDPMSGFFMMRRDRLDEVAPRLSPQGFKILLDIAGSSRLRIAEQPYVFGERFAGEFKFNAQIGLEFLGLLIAKSTGDVIDPRFAFFAMVGSIGLVVHLAVLWGALYFAVDFRTAQVAATLVAMTSNFLLNNEITYRDRRLKGMSALKGFVLFCLFASVGAFASIDLAEWLYRGGSVPVAAGLAGAVMSALWNYAMSTLFVWLSQMSRQNALIVIGVLLVWRIVMAAILPLSADETYYLLWSHHLQAGYFDHPPAIAFLIRAGTFLFGDAPLGVRAMGLPLSLLTAWFVWQTALMLLKNESKAALAAVLFNFTLMANVELLAATPDMPSIATVAAFLWALAKVQTRNEGAWWLMAGACAGLSLLSKYSMLFVGLGTAVWLLADARGRAWLKTPWPWAGGALALAVFAPNLVWQAQHGWITFAFQFGRMGEGAITGRYLAEFAGAQLGLVTPLILVLAGIGFWRARRPGGDRFALFVIVAVALLYFLQHALHDRVQGNWPCFLAPALAIFAADAFGRPRWLSLAAAPLAGVMLLALYLQAALGIIPLKNDPIRRLLARDFPAAAAALAQSAPGGTILTTDYETTSLLRYYRPEMRVIQLNEPWRYAWASAPPAAWFRGQTVYFVETRRDRTDLVKNLFAETTGAIVHPGGYQSAMMEGAVQPTPGKVP